jgi:4-amino-4-deoxy-L-arabinose transferase-like glycosyltransferase
MIAAKPAVIVAGAAFLLYVLLDVYYFPTPPMFPDELRILAEARRLIEDGSFWPENDRAWEMPGTAIFYGIFVYLFSTPQFAILAIRVAQAGLLVLQALLIGVTARRIFGDRRAAFAAFAMTAFYPFLVFHQGHLLSETLFDTLLIAGMAGLYWWRDRGCKLDGFAGRRRLR